MNIVRRCTRAAVLAGAVLWLVVSAVQCGSQREKPAGPPVDETLERLNRAAHRAFEKHRFEQAADLYGRALDRALMRADVPLIADTRYNLAVCLMELGDYGPALDAMAQARAELARTGREIPADMRLLQATILYRDGQNSRAWQVTERLLGGPASLSTVVSNKIYFLRGLMAADIGDADRVRAALTRMTTPSGEDGEGDRAELAGRLALIEQRWDAATATLDEAAGRHRRNLEYRRMTIALALSAKARENAGRPHAAAWRYLQAGRSAALAGASANAEQWLGDALRLAQKADIPEIGRQARDHLEELAGTG